VAREQQSGSDDQDERGDATSGDDRALASGRRSGSLVGRHDLVHPLVGDPEALGDRRDIPDR
jgi:hypothetical protein